jgi:SAM-dependent methyltransferase
LPWRWAGVLHEHLDAGQPVEEPRLPGFWIEVRNEGARSQDPQKFQKDAAVLEAALRQEPQNARYVFYLAQSYRDAGQLALARQWYEKRSTMGGWEEEVWYSLFQLARLTELLGEPKTQVMAAYLRACAARPGRAETLVALARYLRLQSDYPPAYLYAQQATELARSPDRLFVETAAYTWASKDELALAAFYTDRTDQAARLWLELLQSADLPASEIQRVRNNLAYIPGIALPDPAPIPATSTLPPQTAAATGDTTTMYRTPFHACPLCQSTRLSLLGSYNCTGHPIWSAPLPRQLSWLQCDACQHVFTDGFFTEAGLSVLFSKANPHQIAGGDWDQQRFTWAPVVERVLRVVNQQAALLDGGLRWMDIGCGNGGLVFTAAEFGFAATGVDTRLEAVKRIADMGYAGLQGDLMSIEVVQPVNVISMADVLEHIPFPAHALQRVHQLLDAQGVVFISCPNSDCVSWREMDRTRSNPYWAELEHYHNFSRASLAALLSRCGFMPVSYSVSPRYKACMEIIAVKRP